MYQKIKEHSTTLNLYQQRLIDEGVLTSDEIDNEISLYNKKLNEELASAKSYKPNKADWLEGSWKGINVASIDARRGQTSITEDEFKKIGKEIHQIPKDFSPHKRIKKIYDDRLNSINEGKGVDWSTAESLAFASLLAEGYGVRLSGQDSGRGTFSQRHAVLRNQDNHERFVPLNNISKGQKNFEIIDSLLSEFAVLGFEFGYSISEPETLVLWEAQFGDFANGAQIIIDQFISSGESKWGRASGLVMLLPHGYEGQGPEHSSARLERFLQLCAGENLQVVN